MHAIGAGIVLCEIQQNSDVTYRLYDYGRPRELHVDKGLDVARRSEFDGSQTLPIHSQYFVTEEWSVSGQAARQCAARSLLIAVEGEGEIDGRRTQAGEVWHAAEQADVVVRSAGGMRFLVTRPPVVQ